MKLFAETHGFTFPYLYDEDQSVARAYGAVCTPDFFGFNGASSCSIAAGSTPRARRPAPPISGATSTRRCRQVARTGSGPADQIASIGCSIKWKDAA